MLVFDPKRAKEAVAKFFPKEVVEADGFTRYYGVYSRRRLEIPDETVDHPYVESHKLASPWKKTVTHWTAFGTHWRLGYFSSEKAPILRDLLKSQEYLDFYV